MLSQDHATRDVVAPVYTMCPSKREAKSGRGQDVRTGVTYRHSDTLGYTRIHPRSGGFIELACRPWRPQRVFWRHASGRAEDAAAGEARDDVRMVHCRDSARVSASTAS